MKKEVRHVKILARCGMLRHAAACFKTPMCSSKKKGAAACCSMLRHAVAALAWLGVSEVHERSKGLVRCVLVRAVCVGGGGGCHIIEEGLHGSRGGRSAEGGLCQKDV